MKTELTPIAKIKANPDNPRIIKDDKFDKLVKSIQEFPQMLDLRPIVVNSDMMVLGGNMRLRACQKAGLKEVPVLKADDLTPEQQKRFIITDNASFGAWDYDVLANEWEVADLDAWGVDVPDWDNADPKDLSDEIKETFEVIISFDNEQQQQQAYEKLMQEGYQCRALIL